MSEMSDSHESRIDNDCSLDTSVESDRALRTGLLGIPVPTPGPDFDAGVLARMSQPVSLWKSLGLLAVSLKPAFTAAAVSLPVMLGLITWLGQTPLLTSAHHFSPSASARVLPMDVDLDRPDLSPALLRGLTKRETSIRGRRGDFKQSAGRPAAA